MDYEVVQLVVAVLVAIAVWNGRKELRWWGFVPHAGVVAEAVAVLDAVTLARGAIGDIQYFTGLPELVVALHLAGIGALAASHSGAFYRTRRA